MVVSTTQNCVRVLKRNPDWADIKGHVVELKTWVGLREWDKMETTKKRKERCLVIALGVRVFSV